MDPVGLEPTTFRMQSERSSQTELWAHERFSARGDRQNSEPNKTFTLSCFLEAKLKRQTGDNASYAHCLFEGNILSYF